MYFMYGVCNIVQNTDGRDRAADVTLEPKVAY